MTKEIKGTQHQTPLQKGAYLKKKISVLNATRFTVSSELPHIKSGKIYKAIYTLEELP